MTIHLRIERLEWDRWNREHIAKHGVTMDEVTMALINIQFIKPSYKDRLVVYGVEGTGRLLAIVVGEVPDKPNVYHVFSARLANRKERRHLSQEHDS